jgi:hypothetical protein
VTGPGLDHPHAAADEHLVKRRRELAIAVADEKPEPGGTFAEFHEKVTGQLAVHAPVGWAVMPRMCARRVWISILGDR